MTMRSLTHVMPGQAAVEAVKKLESADRKPLLKSVFSTLGRMFCRLIPDDETARKRGEKALRQYLD